ncbi:MAG TPA: hypothetical protein EYQ86_05605, partial [Bacteroidetes bacterium]|nr:hypothetical protein [Bacteroidota bacterium]
MKNISLISLAIAAIILFTYSCKKNEQVDPLYYSNNGSVTNQITSSIQEFFNENKEESQFFTVDASSYNMVEGNQGIRIYFNPNSFKDQNGQIISGNVDIELIEIMTKSEMIHSNKPTNYPGNPNDPNDDEILVSGGEFYINATQNGSDLVLNNQAQVRIPVDNPVTNMELFSGTASDDIGMEWTLDTASTVSVTQDSIG